MSIERGSGGGAAGNSDAERCTVRFAVTDRNGAFVCFDDRPDDGQPKSRTPVLARSPGGRTIERLEDVLLVFRGDARARVVYLKQDGIID